MVLTMNNFKINGVDYFKQEAQLLDPMYPWAIQSGSRWHLKECTSIPSLPPTLLYLRYTDDFFILWRHMQDELVKFKSYTFTPSENIKFTKEQYIVFLDTLVKIDRSTITTDLYFNFTDSHNYFYYDFAHQQRCKDSHTALSTSWWSLFWGDC